MFQSFFPKPKLFFLSGVTLAILAMIVWYFYKASFGNFLGLPFPPESEETIVGVTFFLTNNFLTFYLYYFSLAAIFYLFWSIIAPHKWQNWSILGIILIIFLSFIAVQSGVSLNYWYRTFYDLLQKVLNKEITAEPAQFYESILSVTSLLLFNIIIAVVSVFFVRHYIFRWRIAMNDYYAEKWARIRKIEGASQRIQEDTMRFAELAQPIGDAAIDSVMTLFAFLPILASLSQYVTTLPIIGAVPNALMWCAIIWPLIGTTISIIFGIRLPGMEFKNQRVEAAYRKELVLGEDDNVRADPPTLRTLFKNIKGNYFRLYFHYLYYDMARNLYNQADAIIFLFIMVPSITAVTLSYGVFVQASSAFGKVTGSFQYLFKQWTSIINLISVYKRLAAFEAAIEGQELPKIDQDYLNKTN